MFSDLEYYRFESREILREKDEKERYESFKCARGVEEGDEETINMFALQYAARDGETIHHPQRHLCRRPRR